MRRVRTIDAEVAGEAVRLIVEGGPSVPGRTMMEKLTWLRKSSEELRQALMLEPRGHAGMHGALFTEPVSPGAHAGLLSMNAAGFPAVSGEGVIGAVTLALENRLIEGVDSELRIDTPAGLVRAAPRRDGDRVSSVALTLVPSFVHTAGPAGADSHAQGDGRHRVRRRALRDCRQRGNRHSRRHVERVEAPAHGTRDQGRHRLETAGSRHDIHGAPRGSSDLRTATVLDGAVLRRSPGATGTAALLAVLDAMGLVVDEERFRHEGILGTVLYGRIESRQRLDDVDTITPVIEGAARMTGVHEFLNW